MKNIGIILISLLIIIALATAFIHLLPLILLIALIYWIYRSLSAGIKFSSAKGNAGMNENVSTNYNQNTNNTNNDKNVIDVDYEEV